jgi:hypothetical protein
MDRIVGASQRTQEIVDWLAERGVPQQALIDVVRSAIGDGAVFSLTERRLGSHRELAGRA